MRRSRDGETGRMGKIKNFEDLDVWQMGKSLTLKVYEITANFPKEEVYGITSQVKRASLSVPANIAEGLGRYHYLDKAKFYINARGSLNELKSHLLIAKELGFMNNKTENNIFEFVEVFSLKLNNFINKTRDLKTSRKSL